MGISGEHTIEKLFFSRLKVGGPKDSGLGKGINVFQWFKWSRVEGFS